MNIAIIGAGFSGLAVCWELLNYQNGNLRPSITLFEAKKIGGGASGMAAGLLHPYAGAHAKKNWRATEGIEATKIRLKISEKELGTPVAFETGIFRAATDSKQQTNYQLCAASYDDVEWWDAQTSQSRFPGMGPFPGIFIKTGLTVNCPLYLEGLWKACARMGAIWKSANINSLQELKEFDLIIVAAGALCKKFTELHHLPLIFIKGQLIEIEYPENFDFPDLPVNSYYYLLKHPTKKCCIAGSTFEREFSNSDPDLTTAVAKISPAIELLFPGFKSSKILDCQTGIRVSTPSHRPIYGKCSDKVWYFTGMGSKGLLYHALFAEELVKCIYKS